MANVLMTLIDTEEVEQILMARYECEEDYEAIKQLLMSRVDDGSIMDFLYGTLDTCAWDGFWEVVEEAVLDWAKDVLYKANNTDRE